MRGVYRDCLMRDLQMPGVSRFEVITGHDSPEAEEQALGGGTAAYLRKPVNDCALIETITAAIAQLTARTADHENDAQLRANVTAMSHLHFSPSFTKLPQRYQNNR